MAERKAAKGGRPPAKINWDKFDKYCALQCTQVEIAAKFGCSVDVLERAVREEFGRGFAEVNRAKRQAGFVSLRRKQYQVAMKGNVAMLIWLGKQWLGQRDEHRLALSRDDAPSLESADGDIVTYVATKEQELKQMRLATRGILQLAMGRKPGTNEGGNGSDPTG